VKCGTPQDSQDSNPTLPGWPGILNEWILSQEKVGYDTFYLPLYRSIKIYLIQAINAKIMVDY
jgi:hypothetical protein